MNPYQTLKDRWHRLARIRETMSVLHWDQAVLMPPGAVRARGDQLATLSRIAHEISTQADTLDLITAAQDQDLGKWDRRNLELIAREWRKHCAVPESLAADLTSAATAGEFAWGQARDRDDFSLARDALQRNFDLARERAHLLSDTLGGVPYDLLMDDFEPGLTQGFVDLIFEDYAKFLPDFLNKVQKLQAADPPVMAPTGPFDVEQQAALGREIAAILGFDFDRGRLDVSRHPFCGGYRDDVRMTTRYDQADFTTALMGLIHETGHGLYENGLPMAYATQPVGQASGLAMHESQSLLMEMQASRSPAFVRFLFHQAQAKFKGAGPAWTAENMQRLYTRVQPGPIRVDADEVTYPAHVIVRYEIEKALFSGALKIADLPTAFADGLEQHLGVRPASDFQGVLQDIHWYSGGFGYFPTYSLGAMMAAQLYEAAHKALDQDESSLDQDLAQGDFSRLLSWLRCHVHQQGSITDTNGILQAATGRPLDPSIFKQHLYHRYLGGQE